MTHPHNPQARRSANGIWNEDTLPVTDWERPDRRIVLPSSLVGSLGEPKAVVLRWDAEKFEMVMLGHQRDLDVILNLDRYLADWRYMGWEARSGRVRVLFPDEHGRWYQVSIGALLGSWHVITVFGSSAQGFPRKRMGGLVDIKTCTGGYLKAWDER